MTRTIWTGVCATFVSFSTAALIAQQPPPSQQQQPPPSQQQPPPQQQAPQPQRPQQQPAQQQQPPAQQQRSADQITVTGCLKEAPGTAAAPAPVGTAGTAGTTGTTGTAGAATDPAASQQKFLLTNASAGPAADPAAAAGTTPPATPASPTASAAQTYRLIANPAALSPHVGKKLELTGTLESAASAAQDASAGPGANAPMLRVQSGKIIAASCSQ